jgi:hypothetical protein
MHGGGQDLPTNEEDRGSASCGGHPPQPKKTACWRRKLGMHACMHGGGQDLPTNEEDRGGSASCGGHPPQPKKTPKFCVSSIMLNQDINSTINLFRLVPSHKVLCSGWFLRPRLEVLASTKVRQSRGFKKFCSMMLWLGS